MPLWWAALVLLVACGRAARNPGHPTPPTVPPLPSAGCRAGNSPAVDGERRRITVGGEQRSYLIDVPAAPADRPLPVVLSFHGFRSTAWLHRWGTGLGSLARREELIALSPEGHEGVHLLDTTGRGWDLRPEEIRDVTFVRALLDQLEAERCVDRRRVFATGMSNGGFFANLLGCALSDRLAAIAPVAGAMELGRCEPARPIPVLLIYGRGDQVVPLALVQGARDWWLRVNGCQTSAPAEGCTRHEGRAAEVLDCEGGQGHSWPSDATEQVWRFFQAHPRG